MSLIQANGQHAGLIVPEKKPPSIFFYMFMQTLPFIIFPVFTLKSMFQRRFRHFPFTSFSLYRTIRESREKEQNYHQDPALLKELWKMPSAKAYLGSLEYQMQEGYCGSSTMRCILRSFGMKDAKLPPQKRGETAPPRWCPHIKETAEEYQKENQEDSVQFELTTNIVRGDVSYDEFERTLREGLANPNVRVACNFLRSALFGFETCRLVPFNFLISLYGGHFSPILGLVDRPGGCDDHASGEEKKDESGDDPAAAGPLVAIFDTNAKYGGVYLVSARKLHGAVGAVDVFANEPRAVILVEKSEKEVSPSG